MVSFSSFINKNFITEKILSFDGRPSLNVNQIKLTGYLDIRTYWKIKNPCQKEKINTVILTQEAFFSFNPSYFGKSCVNSLMDI